MVGAPTPYDLIGGEAAVREVLQSLYDKLFGDAMVGFLFEGKNKDHLVEQQVAFACGFLGGPQKYAGKPLPEAHASIPLLPGHFDRRHWLLQEVLRDRHVPEEVSAVWLRIDEGLRTSILASGRSACDKTREPDRNR